MLSMFKDKKGFSVLFRDTEKDTSAPPRDTENSVRRSSRVSGVVSRYTGGSCTTQLQCQRCSKRFSLLDGADGESSAEGEAQACCRRCGYPTCPQCREAVAGTPPWVCCVCDGPKSFMWLLEKTKLGPRLVSKIVEFCDPRGQRLMRSMFRFTLQQYRAVSSPRPSITAGIAGRLSGTPAAPSKSRTSARASGERGGALTALSASHGNAHRPSPYSHPKHASLRRAAGRLSAPAGEGKENAAAVRESVSPKRPHGSEALRRDDAAGVTEYSPEPLRQVLRLSDGTEAEEEDGETSPRPSAAHPQPLSHLSDAADRCTAVQDIYRVSDTAAAGCTTLVSNAAGNAEETSASPHVRPSGRAAFAREALHHAPQNNNADATAESAGEPITLVARETKAVRLRLDATTMCVTPAGAAHSGRLGRSLSRASSGSGRSESPAPRFPSFAQFLDDQAAVGAGQTHLPRESDALVTVSPNSSSDGDRDSNVVELGATRSSRHTGRRNTNGGGQRTPRATQPRTPTSARDTSSRRGTRRTAGGLSGDFTPTRVLDLSDARVTVRHGSSSRRRTTRGSLKDMHAPHLYGGGGGGTGRRSGQIGDSPFLHEPVGSFAGSSGGGGARVASARGQPRRQHLPLATRTAGRALGGAGDTRVRPARPVSRTTTPLQRTASRNGVLRRIPSSGLARTNSSTAQFARRNSAVACGTGFGRQQSGTAHLVRTPSSRGHLVAQPSSPYTRGQPLQRTESAKFGRTASAVGLHRTEVHSALERTHSRGGLGGGGASPLRRTASHTNLGGPSPLCRLPSAATFVRSATATAGFTRTNSANVFGRPAGHIGATAEATRQLHSTSSRAFARTATGTYLASGAAGRSHTTAAASRPAASYALRRDPISKAGGGGVPRVASARKRVTGGPAVPASPFQRTNTATRNAAVRPPTPTDFTRTASGARGFERQQSGTGRQRAFVDPAPALVGVARRKNASAAAPRRTPSALTRSDSAAAAGGISGATPRTPRPYIVSSVSIAGATPHGGHGLHGGARPLLSSGTCSPKTRSTRDSLTSGSAGTTRTSGGGVMPVSTTPVVKAPTGMALAGRTSAPRRRPEAASASGGGSGAARGAAFTRSGTSTRGGSAAAMATRDTHKRTGSTHPPSGFMRLHSRPTV